MIVALAFHAGDVTRAVELLDWIHQLGGCHDHALLLVSDASVPWERGVEAMEIANLSFKSVSLITTDESVSGWPQGPNALFLKAARYCHALKQAFLWLEPDAIPLSRGWLNQIQQVWDKVAGNRILGFVYPCSQPGLPERLISGVSVYPSNAVLMFEPFIISQPTVAWDVSSARPMQSSFEHTDLIHHFNPPKDQPTSFPTLIKVGDIKDKAVLFHTNKDGTLIKELRRTMGISAPGNFVVVLPFCNYDAPLLEALLQWIITLQIPMTHEVLLSYDASTLGATVRRLESYAAMTFPKVHKTSYRMGAGVRFPQTAAWQHAARYMGSMGRSWLWMEADCVPLRQDFLIALQSFYDKARKPFAGPFVHARGHMNGTGIYPANTPKLLPRTMSHTDNAWDVEMASEMMHMAADLNGLWFHVWGVVNGRLDPISGESPSFDDALFRQIPSSAVIMHRCKDQSLFKHLRPRIKSSNRPIQLV